MDHRRYPQFHIPDLLLKMQDHKAGNLCTLSISSAEEQLFRHLKIERILATLPGTGSVPPQEQR